MPVAVLVHAMRFLLCSLCLLALLQSRTFAPQPQASKRSNWQVHVVSALTSVLTRPSVPILCYCIQSAAELGSRRLKTTPSPRMRPCPCKPWLTTPTAYWQARPLGATWPGFLGPQDPLVRPQLCRASSGLACIPPQNGQLRSTDPTSVHILQDQHATACISAARCTMYSAVKTQCMCGSLSLRKTQQHDHAPDW